MWHKGINKNLGVIEQGATKVFHTEVLPVLVVGRRALRAVPRHRQGKEFWHACDSIAEPSRADLLWKAEGREHLQCVAQGGYEGAMQKNDQKS
ncbi:hypothetical protein [Comamonas sp. C11]|uniref:hypothetical protein n=1 Tax=Comamonas sp. C11 TaxID=2966554 RepID=UPI002113818A|nr:hypothetical protein [Comamonas sp. C11]UUC94380.1 hypothetical protein NOX35_03290 [Comamonas sp. C11]